MRKKVGQVGWSASSSKCLSLQRARAALGRRGPRTLWGEIQPGATFVSQVQHEISKSQVDPDYRSALISTAFDPENSVRPIVWTVRPSGRNYRLKALTKFGQAVAVR